MGPYVEQHEFLHEHVLRELVRDLEEGLRKDQHMFGELEVDGTWRIEVSIVICQCIPVHGCRHERVMVLSLLDINVVDSIRLQVLGEEPIRRRNQEHELVQDLPDDMLPVFLCLCIHSLLHLAVVLLHASLLVCPSSHLTETTTLESAR